MMKLETISATAPGKIILFGEHAVVYGRPAIAVPVAHVFTQATIEPRDDERVIIDAADLAHQYDLRDAPTDDPLAMIIRLTCAKLDVEPRGFRVRVESTIPIGGGLGSGAAVTVAIARALNKFFTPHPRGHREKRIKLCVPCVVCGEFVIGRNFCARVRGGETASRHTERH